MNQWKQRRRNRVPHQLPVCLRSGKRRFPDVEVAREFLQVCATSRARYGTDTHR